MSEFKRTISAALPQNNGAVIDCMANGEVERVTLEIYPGASANDWPTCEGCEKQTCMGWNGGGITFCPDCQSKLAWRRV